MSPVTIPRRGRSDEQADTPHHFERTLLRPAVRAAAWPAGAAAAAGGIALAVLRQDSPLEVVGALIATVAGLVLLGLFRCRSHEVVIGRKWIHGRAGPLGGRVPVGLVESHEVRPSTGWRRLYSLREVVVRLGHGGRELVLPSDEPEALGSAVEEMQDRSRRIVRGEPAAAVPPRRSP